MFLFGIVHCLSASVAAAAGAAVLTGADGAELVQAIPANPTEAVMMQIPDSLFIIAPVGWSPLGSKGLAECSRSNPFMYARLLESVGDLY